MTLAATTPADLAARYCDVRSHTEALASPLTAEDQMVQSMPDTSPTKWHRGHTTWFFEQFLLEPSSDSYRIFHPAFAYLFNSYYEAVGARHPRPERGVVSRPGIDEVAAYRRHVDEAMVDVLSGRMSERGAELLELGLNHEQQHQELLLMDIKHALAQNVLDPVYRPEEPAGEEIPLEWIECPGGTVDVGAPDSGFSFDNERPRHPVLLQPYAIASRPVTNADWLEFIADGGYERADLWLSDGWALVQAGALEAPLYWRQDGGEWSEYTLAGRRSLDGAAPVCHVSYFEADAFARWAGARLPTEQEWEAASVPIWRTPLSTALQPTLRHTGDRLAGLGQVWEWTSSAYLPYPGFRTEPGAVGEYNGKFMVNQHVLRGGCCLTPPGHARVSYRNFFPPQARWACAGLRLARDGE